MKRFALLVTLIKQSTKQGSESSMKEHISSCDCNTCDIKDICPINNPDIKLCSLIEHDDYALLKRFITLFQRLFFVDIVVLIDSEKDVLYVHKGEGTLEHIKKTYLPSIVKMYDQSRNQQDSFFAIEDARALAQLFDPSMNGGKNAFRFRKVFLKKIIL